jgi:hypothetical protein
MTAHWAKRKAVVGAAVAVVAVFAAAQAANAVTIANYEFSDGSSPAVTAADPNVTASDFAVSGASLTVDASEPKNGNTSPSGSNMAGADMDEDVDYFNLTLTPDAGATMTITGVQFHTGKGNAPSNFTGEVRYVVGGGAETVAGTYDIDRTANTQPLLSRSVSISGVTAVTDPVEIRWYMTDFSDRVGMDDVEVHGTVEAAPVIPEPVSALAVMMAAGALGGYLRRRRR